MKLSTRKGFFSVFFLSAAFCVLNVCFTSCVPVDQLPPGSVPTAPGSSSGTATAAYPDPDQGSLSITSTHFTLKGYTQTDLDNLKQMAESEYNKIGNDTGLYTFLASGNFTLVEYKDRDEYLSKTHQPTWSHMVATANAIYLYPDQDQEAVLAHYMSHMIFSSYMGEKANTSGLKWLDEGMAMNQEVAKMSDSDRNSYANSKSSQLRQNRVPFSQMAFFVPNTEEKRRTDEWYQQVESVVTYLLAQGSALAFGQLMSELKSGVDMDQAISDAYGAKFRNLNDLESAWKYTL